jgi:hypothetical protein
MPGESGIGKRAFRDLAICGAGLVYLALVLFVNLDSPILGMLLIVLAGYELVGPHRHRRGR